MPSDCIVRIMAFAGMLDKLDQLNTYFRRLALSYRLTYSHRFCVSYEQTRIPRTVEELHMTMGMSDVSVRSITERFSLGSLLREYRSSILQICWHWRRVYLERIEHMQALEPRPVFHYPGCILSHLQRARCHYAAAGGRPPLQADLQAYRRSLFRSNIRRASNGKKRYIIYSSFITYRIPPWIVKQIRQSTTHVLALIY